MPICTSYSCIINIKEFFILWLSSSLINGAPKVPIKIVGFFHWQWLTVILISKPVDIFWQCFYIQSQNTKIFEAF